MLPTVREQLLARADDDRPGLLFEDRAWSWAEVVLASAVRSAVLDGLLAPDRPPHVAVLLDNVPEFVFTSGTSGDPKAVKVTQAKIAHPGQFLSERFGLGPGEVAYVGKPLTYVLATPERADDADLAIGELVNTQGAGAFAGYYNDDDAEAERMRGGVYWSGDLAYRDAAGFVYFAGRTADWLRVDGENLAAAPIERILPALPRTATNKVLKRELAADGPVAGTGTLWVRDGRGRTYR